MALTLTLSNYRCFGSDSPAVIRLKPGFSAFVGINNSGKSTILRSLFEFRELFDSLSGREPSSLVNLVRGNVHPLRPMRGISDLEELFCNRNTNDIEIGIQVESSQIAPDEITQAKITINRKSKQYRVDFFKQDAVVRSPSGGQVVLEDGRLTISNTHVGNFKKLTSECAMARDSYYVPAFRHITAFSPREAQVRETADTYYDVMVGRTFIDLWDERQNGASYEARKRSHELVRDIRELFSFKELQITKSRASDSLQLMIDGKPFRIEELGAGLAQFIVVLGNAAFKFPTYVLIDEPEINLHPALQLKFVTKLAGYAQQGILYATHNIGLARTASDEIYAVQTGGHGSTVSPLDRAPRLAELIGELNFEGFRALGFHKVLLVEGRTDVKTYIEFLRIYGKDHEFLVVPLGGSAFINGDCKDELQELTRICPNVSCVIDSEKSAIDAPLQRERAEFEQVCRDLPVPVKCHILARRATEHYLSELVIKELFGEGFRAFNHYEKRSDLPNCWPKAKNWMVARKMDRADLDGTDLGEFLAQI